MINLGTETPWGFHYGFNINVDFCIWVLEIDGLRVTPFDCHAPGNGELVARGMDISSWRKWLAKVVATQDHRLNWRIKDQQLSLTEGVASFEKMTSMVNQQMNVPAVHSSLENMMAWQHQQYQMATAQLGQISKDVEPPDIWIDEPMVGEQIKELWQHYLALLETQDSNHGRELIVELPDNLWNELQPYHTRLATLQIHQVNYPRQVEYLVPPVSVILSVTNQIPDSEELCQRILRAAESLTRSSSS